MINSKNNSKYSYRIEWIDNSKTFACLLVVIGHLLMSLRKIDNFSVITEFIIWFIYLFHMPVFMCLSGYLYHKNKKINTFNEYRKFEIKKIINLIIPYVFFYSITIILNMMFSSSVNTPKGLSEWLGILNNPISPYWFIYALLSLFLIVPILEKILKNKKIVFLFLVFLKIISIFINSKIYFINSIMQNGIYFYLGVFIRDKTNYKLSLFFTILYLLSSLIVYCNLAYFNVSTLRFLRTIFGVVGTVIFIEIFKNVEKKGFMNPIKKYTFQIFLMHTIFAACFRIILFKIGINKYFVHLFVGLIASILFPIIIAKICEKIRLLNIVFYPLKTIDELKKENKLCQMKRN